MSKYLKLALCGTAAMLLASEAAYADPVNEPPPVGAILDLNGTPVPHTYQQYTVSFAAAVSNTALTFAFRDDPAFLLLDDVSLTDITNPGGNLVQNGDFEGGTTSSNGNSAAAVDWTYANIYGAEAGGVVGCGGTGSDAPHGGSCDWIDGAVQAYDAISQVIPTAIGDTYQLTFWLSEDGSLTTFSDLSTNGDTTDTGGNGIDLLVYAQAGLPPAATPEPASLSLLGMGLFGLGYLRRRRK